MAITPEIAKAMSDTEIDAAYAASFDNYQALAVDAQLNPPHGTDAFNTVMQNMANAGQDTTVLEQEILMRVGTITGSLEALAGRTQFPEYNKRGHFQAVSVMRQAVADSVQNLKDNIASAGNNYLKPLAIGAGVLLILGIIYKAS